MTLAEWKQLTEDKRDSLAKRWNEIGEPRQLGIIAEEAASNLFAAIQHLPNVNCVMIAEWPKKGVYILVSTDLREGEKLPEIPDKFETFDVIQAGMADAKRRYLECWRTVSAKICRWTEDEMRQKMDHLDALLDERGSVVYYRGALYYFAGELVHEAAPSLVGLPLVNLRYEVMAALEQVDGQSFKFPNEHADYDWPAARQRVATAFQHFGISWSGSTVKA